jgi:chromatin remodeling complex protein RSC6
LSLSQYPDRYRVLPQLAALIGVQEDSLSNILGALWAYIKARGLQAPDNKAAVSLDEPLKAVSRSAVLLAP